MIGIILLLQNYNCSIIRVLIIMAVLLESFDPVQADA